MFSNTENPNKTPLLILILFIIHLSAGGGFFTANATVRYVSHNGSNTPPYTSWATAADSIMSAINISVFGDTIYVANGIYKEQVVMIPGLSLIGAGMDSCVIDTKDLVTSTGFVAVDVKDNCLLTGFHIIVYYNSEMGYGIASGSNTYIAYNMTTNSKYGIYSGWTGNSFPIIYSNHCENVSIGIEMFNSSATVRNNQIYVPANSNSFAGIRIEAFDFSYIPVIDSNYIVVEGLSYTAADGIRKSFGAKPTITNNVILLKGPQNDGIFLGDADSGWVYNNLIIGASGDWAIMNFAIPYLQLYNNYITGDFDDREYALVIGLENVAKNNVVANVKRGVRVWENESPVFQYNNIWNNDINYSGITPDSTNISLDPMIVNYDSTNGELDFHLQMFSPLIDAGDPNILDKDSTRSDIGLYGGSFGESYTYFDLAPRPPVNLTAEVDSIIKLRWNKNTEADFDHYNLYRDTVKNFTIDTTKLVASVIDTFYQHIILAGVESLYFKLTGVDNQGNESNPSEELAIIVTSVEEYPTVVNNYRLYQNYPNPFNPSTTIGYKLKERGYVKLYVYDVKGELVSVLVNQTQEAGYYEVEFSDERQGARGKTLTQRLASGVYIYQMHIISENNIPVFSNIKKMVYIK